MKFTVLLATSLLAIIVIGSACSGLKPINVLNAVTPDVGYTVQEDIRYGAENRQTMDLYRPDSSESGQVVVFVYGGAWRKGEKSEYKFVAQALASEGHTVVIPDYRLYPEVRFPDFVTDVAMAITALDELDIGSVGKKRDVVIMGHSSGAHTAAMIASDPAFLEAAGAGFTVSALIGIAGPYDLPMTNPEVTDVFANIADHDTVKPVRLVTADHPRTLLIHGADDKRVKPAHTERYFRALKANGVAVEMVMLEGTGHAKSIAGLAAPLDKFNPIKETIQAFLEQ